MTSPAKLAEILNKFFVNKIEKIRQNIPTSMEDPLKTLKYIMKGKDSKLSLKCVHPDTVREIILGLKIAKHVELTILTLMS